MSSSDVIVKVYVTDVTDPLSFRAHIGSGMVTVLFLYTFLRNLNVSDKCEKMAVGECKHYLYQKFRNVKR